MEPGINNHIFQVDYDLSQNQRIFNNRCNINIRNRPQLFGNLEFHRSQNMSQYQDEEGRDVEMIDVMNNFSTIVYRFNG